MLMVQIVYYPVREGVRQHFIILAETSIFQTPFFQRLALCQGGCPPNNYMAAWHELTRIVCTTADANREEDLWTILVNLQRNELLFPAITCLP